jgi:hypothetical protein
MTEERSFIVILLVPSRESKNKKTVDIHKNKLRAYHEREASVIP